MALSFDGYTIDNTHFLIDTIDHYSIPNKDVSIFKLANADKSSIALVEYPSKGIRISGLIRCDDDYDLGAYIDIFKGYLRATDANLDIPYGAVTRRYIATVNSCDIKRTIALTSAKFTIDFICSEPFGRETSSTSLFTGTNQTDASETYTPTIGGNAPYQLPIITITIDALTGTNDYIQISNNNNGQSMLVTGVGFVNGDVLVVNCEERTVTKNGDPVDYEGTFLELEPGASSITISNGFTTRTMDYSGVYYKRYL